MANPTITLFATLTAQAHDTLTLDDAVRGVLDDATYPLGTDTVDITSESQTISIQRGRNRELDEMSAGTCNITWPHDDGRFDPLNTASPYYGLNLVGRRVRVDVDGVTIFDGRTEDWTFSYSPGGIPTVTMRAVDAFGQLGRKEFDEWTTTAQLAGARVEAILDHDDVRYGSNRVIDAGVSTLQADLVTWGSNVLNYLQLVARSDLGRLFVDRTGVLRYVDRSSVLNQSAEAVFTADAALLWFDRIQRTIGTDMVFNRVSVDRVGGTKQTVVDETSIDEYELRSLSLSGLLLDSDIAAADLANYKLSLYKTAISRVESFSVTLDALTAAQAGAVLALDIADVAEVIFTPDGLSDPIDQTVIIEGIAHSLSVAGVHTVTFNVSLADSRRFIELDDATLGVLDAGVALAF